MSYTQLTQEQRYQIYALLKIGHNRTEIAILIDNHKSTVSRQLKRNNGKEFAEHEKIAYDLQVHFFFAHPYAAWERGANENMNGLIRQYIPKSRDLTSVANTDLVEIMSYLNHHQRKYIDFQLLIEVCFEVLIGCT